MWGIDAYTRRNIELALADAEPASLRMVPDEVRAFLEGELLPALNRQSDAHAHRISFALAELETNLIELRSTVSNARRDLPFIERRLAGVRAVQRAIVEWEAPDEEGGFSRSRMFCVHPKGCGVICSTTKPGTEGIAQGDFISEYAGELFPSWLWMQKEEYEELQR